MLYILHFSEPLGDTTNPKGYALHYSGCCADGRLEDRLLEHRSGYGSKITRAAVERGISLELAATLEGSYTEEKILKLQKNTPRYCPICRQEKLLKKMGL